MADLVMFHDGSTQTVTPNHRPIGGRYTVEEVFFFVDAPDIMCGRMLTNTQLVIVFGHGIEGTQPINADASARCARPIYGNVLFTDLRRLPETLQQRIEQEGA